MLERMARIARGLPGHVVSVDSSEETPIPEDATERQISALENGPESGVVLRIDGVVADELVDWLSG